MDISYRDLFHRIMSYGSFDRMPVVHWTGWPETNEKWERENGIAPDRQHQFFNAEPMWQGIGPSVILFPGFEVETIEETDEYLIQRDAEGVVRQAWKNKSCIPHFIDFTLKDRSGLREYLDRLQPHPDRVTDALRNSIETVEKGTAPMGIFCGSMVGVIRNWMGVMNFAVACNEDPDMVAQLVDTMSNTVCATIEPLLREHRFDLGYFWEDICGRNGPLITPQAFHDLVVPGYRRIADLLHKHGVEHLLVDSDGWIDPLVPHWLEAGVNILFPLEIGAWDADPMEYRRKYGKDLRLFGGFNKLVLEKGPAAIDAELERRIPLMADGGFIPMPDHAITPGTTVENYQYYLEKLRGLRF